MIWLGFINLVIFVRELFRKEVPLGKNAIDLNMLR